MIKKIDANKYGVVRYAISSIEDIADLPREVSVGSEAIFVNEDGEKKFRLGSDGWVEVVEVKEYDENKLRDMLEDAKVGYGGIEYETLEERLDKDFDNVYSVLDNRTYVEYEGCRITAKDSLNGLQKETVVKGRTLQNLVDKYNYLPNKFLASCYHKKGMIKPNTTYTSVIYNYSSELLQIYINEISFNYKLITVEPNRYRVDKFQSKETLDTGSALFKNHIKHELDLNYKVLFLEGDYTETPLEELPFIEGIESVGDKSKNLFDYNKLTYGYYFNPATGEYEAINVGCTTGYIKFNKCNITISGLYDQVSSYVGYYDINYNYIGRSSGNPVTEHKLTVGSVIADSSYRGYAVPANAEYITLNIYKNLAVNPDVTEEMIKENIKQVQFEEGAKATPYQEYYDGYKISGKSCGKNLIKNNNYKCIFPTSGHTGYEKLSIIEKNIRVKPNTTYYLRYTENHDNSSIKVITSEYPITASKHNDAYGERVREIVVYRKAKITTLENENYITLTTGNWECAIKNYFDFVDFQLEESDVPTSYEPYKESTYSYILDEPLRSLPNGVCDEIDLEKGIVTRRVGKFVFKGDEGLVRWANQCVNDTTAFYLSHNIHKQDSKIICNRLPVVSAVSDDSNTNFECIDTSVIYLVRFRILNSNLESQDVVGARKLLSKWYEEGNPLTIYYELANPTTEYLIKDDKFVTLPNGVKDEISHNSVLRKVGKIVLDGCKVYESVTGVEGIVRWAYNLPKAKMGGSCICSMFDYVTPAQTWKEPFKDGITVNSENGTILIYMDRYKEMGRHIKEVGALLDGLEVYYELETPYTEPIDLNEVILNTIRLKSYEPITHITSDNYLLPTIKTQIPTDFNAVVQGLKSNNEELTSQVMSLRQTNDELETTNREQDDVIDVTLLALDEVYGMIDEGEIETMSVGSPMVNVYVKMIKRGIKTLDEVPAKYRTEVEELI